MISGLIDEVSKKPFFYNNFTMSKSLRTKVILKISCNIGNFKSFGDTPTYNYKSLFALPQNKRARFDLILSQKIHGFMFQQRSKVKWQRKVIVRILIMRKQTLDLTQNSIGSNDCGPKLLGEIKLSVIKASNEAYFSCARASFLNEKVLSNI
jgi:hypothetical protein